MRWIVAYDNGSSGTNVTFTDVIQSQGGDTTDTYGATGGPLSGQYGPNRKRFKILYDKMIASPCATSGAIGPSSDSMQFRAYLKPRNKDKGMLTTTYSAAPTGPLEYTALSTGGVWLLMLYDDGTTTGTPFTWAANVRTYYYDQ